MIIRSDKGNGVVVMDKVIYNQQMYALLSDKNEFKKLSEDPPKLREGQLQRYLREFLDDGTCEGIYPSGSQPSRLYGTPKVHKIKSDSRVPPFRPIVSSIGNFNYNVSRFLCDMLTPFILTDYCTQDSFSFVKEVQEVSVSDYFMVSYDVCSLFTNIPLNETIDLANDVIFDNNQSMSITKPQLKKLFVFATSQTHFLFNNEIYDQTDRVAIGSPLGPALANLFMGYHENKWLNSEESSTVLFYKRYVDDIFCLFKRETDAERFLTFLNGQHSNIKFTIEKEKNNQLPFLDILNDSSSNKLVTSVYRKPTYTGLLTNYNSFTSPNYKKGLIKTLIDQTFRINSTWSGFHYDILNLKSVLQKNEFPLKLIDKSISKYLSNNVFKQKENEQMPLLESSKKCF